MRASWVAILVLAASAAAPALSVPIVYVVAPLSLAIPADLLVTFAPLPVFPSTLLTAMPPPLISHCTDAMIRQSPLPSLPTSDSPASSSAVTIRVPKSLSPIAPSKLLARDKAISVRDDLSSEIRDLLECNGLVEDI